MYREPGRLSSPPTLHRYFAMPRLPLLPFTAPITRPAACVPERGETATTSSDSTSDSAASEETDASCPPRGLCPSGALIFFEDHCGGEPDRADASDQQRCDL